jgi:hypothetical protein
VCRDASWPKASSVSGVSNLAKHESLFWEDPTCACSSRLSVMETRSSGAPLMRGSEARREAGKESQEKRVRKRCRPAALGVTTFFPAKIPAKLGGLTCAGYVGHPFTKSKAVPIQWPSSPMLLLRKDALIRKLKNRQAHAQWSYMHLHFNQAERKHILFVCGRKRKKTLSPWHDHSVSAIGLHQSFVNALAKVYAAL